MRSILLLIAISNGLLACSIMQRSEPSGYANNAYEENYNPTKDFYLERKDHYQQQVGEELGIDTSRPVSEKEALAIKTRLHLKRLEAGLAYSDERRQYYTFKPYLSDPERIYFLRLPSTEARSRWAHGRGITPNGKNHNPYTVQLIEKSDVAEGMTRAAVRESWGDPDIVEVAGNTLYGNERWKYKKLVSGVEGYSRETRIIYFEAGRVIGWEKL